MICWFFGAWYFPLLEFDFVLVLCVLLYIFLHVKSHFKLEKGDPEFDMHYLENLLSRYLVWLVCHKFLKETVYHSVGHIYVQISWYAMCICRNLLIGLIGDIW